MAETTTEATRVGETLRAVVEPLAAIERGAGSPGERHAAQVIAGMLRDAGAENARVEEEAYHHGYARLLLPLGAAGLAASVLVARGRRVTGSAIAAVSSWLTFDDVENRTRVWRRLATRPRTTWNVVAECGDLSAERTLVVLAHHDAAPTGHAFDPSMQRALAARFPGLVQKSDTALPIWWPVVAGPVLSMVAAVIGSRRLARIGVALSGLSIGLGLDIARERIVPGANDNLSAVAALVAVAGALRERPVSGVRVVLASCGAEEVLQGGIYGFRDRHLTGLDPSRTWVLNLDTVGSPELVMIEGEGPFVMHDYCDPAFRDIVAAVAERATGDPLHRGTRARASTDTIITSRAGFPSACLVSWEPDTKLLSNYHLFTDVPENLCYETIERAAVVTEALARELGAAAD